MTNIRFLQIHSLTPYTAALLNRDDTGLAKRLRFGGVSRTRISSQCLKRHWRHARDPHALGRIDAAGAAWRSRELVTKKVLAPLGDFPEDVVQAIEPALQKLLYGGKGAARQSRQPLLFAEAELAWLAGEAARLAREADGDADAAREAAEIWAGSMRGNLSAMREAAAIPGGLPGALFGRMVTSDPQANIAAAIHVAHAFTVHEEEAEIDYFTAVDDLAEAGEDRADTIQDTELNCGVFYGYVVVDLPGLCANLGGNRHLAGEVLHNLVYLIAEISPGARLGSTAPYGRAELMLLEAGDRQPRSLAGAFRTPCAPAADTATRALHDHLAALDDAYATGEARRVMALDQAPLPGTEAGSLAELAAWARSLP